MSSEYDPKQIESKWQKVWEKDLYNAETESTKPKYYALIEFPYPSGDGLHVGHPRPYIGMDVIARKRRMEGFDVLYPIGWDAFGLPTENYAIKTGRAPREITIENTDTFRKQIKSLGISFDWSREINTTDPKYYKWTQWLFLKFLEHDLAYKAKIAINWCPKDKIGLANEEVVNGCCERCGTPVEKREKEQWMLAITKYADRLDKDLDTVDFPERVKTQQRNWIGRSEGAEIDFETTTKEKIKVFTTRPDTIFGATYMVLAPEHDLIQKLKSQISNWDEVGEYIKKAKSKTEIDRTGDKEKTGVELVGIKAINPATKEEIPVWIADYVLPHYGTGAIMAVPAHDQRDFEFAQKYNLLIKQVIAPIFVDKVNPTIEGAENTERNGVIVLVKHWSEEKYLLNYSPKFNWKCLFTGGIEEGENPLESAVREIQEETGYQNIKEARYIPLEHVDKFHAPHKGVNRIVTQKNVFIQLADGEKREISQEEMDLHHLSWLTKEEMRETITLQNHLFIFNFEMSGGSSIPGSGILINSGKFNDMDSGFAQKEISEFVGGKMVTRFKLRDWVFSRQRYWGEPIPVIHCEKCGIVPVPEKDLPVMLPEVKNYQPTDNGESPLATISDWVNVKCPKCGGEARRETDTMPNWAGSSWYFLRYTDPFNDNKFASKKSLDDWMPVDWYNGGMEHTTLHLLYSRFWNKFLFDIGLVPTSEPYKKRTSHGLILAEGGEKMSKSKGNVVNPDNIIERFGADTLRVYEMFMGPFEQAIAWSEDSLVGPRRFIEKVWKLKEKVIDSKEEFFGSPNLHKTIKKVTNDIELMNFNTAISNMMIFVNALEKQEKVFQDEYEALLKLLNPFAPHITEEIWHELGHVTLLGFESWPDFDENKLEDNEVTIGVQINGKLRATLVLDSNSGEEETRLKALALPELAKWLEGQTPKKVIVVLGKIVNIVV